MMENRILKKRMYIKEGREEERKGREGGKEVKRK